MVGFWDGDRGWVLGDGDPGRILRSGSGSRTRVGVEVGFRGWDWGQVLGRGRDWVVFQDEGRCQTLGLGSSADVNVEF